MFEKRCRGCEAAASLGALCGGLELASDDLVGSQRSVSDMPSSPVRIDSGIGCSTERHMSSSPFVGTPGSINSGAQERVSENDSCSDLHEVVGFRRTRRVRRDAALLGGTPEQSRVTGWLGSCNEEELLSAFGQLRNAAVEARLDSLRQLLGLRDGKAAGQARRSPPARKLQ